MVRFTALLIGARSGSIRVSRAQSIGTPTLVISAPALGAIERAPEANFTGDVRVERLYDRSTLHMPVADS